MHDRGGGEHQPIRLQVQKSYSKDNHLPLQDSRNKTKTWQNSKCVLDSIKHKERRFLNAFICRQISAIISLRIHTWSLMTTTATVTRNQQQKIFWMTIIKIYNQINKQALWRCTNRSGRTNERTTESPALLTTLNTHTDQHVCLPPETTPALDIWHDLHSRSVFNFLPFKQLFVTTVSQL